MRFFFVLEARMQVKSPNCDNMGILDISRVRTSPSDPDVDQKNAAQTTDIDPKEERAFVWRLDLGFLVIGFLGYMFKYIDQTNIVRLPSVKMGVSY